MSKQTTIFKFAGKEFKQSKSDCFRLLKGEKSIKLDTNQGLGLFVEEFETEEDCNNRWNQLKLEELIKEIELVDIANLRKSDKQLTQALLKLNTSRGKAVDCVKELLSITKRKEEEITSLKNKLEEIARE